MLALSALHVRPALPRCVYTRTTVPATSTEAAVSRVHRGVLWRSRFRWRRMRRPRITLFPALSTLYARAVWRNCRAQSQWCRLDGGRFSLVPTASGRGGSVALACCASRGFVLAPTPPRPDPEEAVHEAASAREICSRLSLSGAARPSARLLGAVFGASPLLSVTSSDLLRRRSTAAAQTDRRFARHGTRVTCTARCNERWHREDKPTATTRVQTQCHRRRRLWIITENRCRQQRATRGCRRVTQRAGNKLRESSR